MSSCALLSLFKPNHNNRKQRTSHAIKRLRIEPLEGRRLLSAASLVQAMPNYSPGYATAAPAALVSTQTVVASSASPSVYGQYVVFTATVTASNGTTPGGTASFSIDGGTPTSATFSTALPPFPRSGLSVGTHSISATFAATSTLDTSTGMLSQTVNKDGTTTVLSIPVAAANKSTTLTATVSPASPGYGYPGGTVTFYDGSTPLGTGTLSSSRTASYTYTTASPRASISFPPSTAATATSPAARAI